MYEETAISQDAQWIDFMIRGEGEESFRRLVNGLAGKDTSADIPSLSYKAEGIFAHNPQGENLDLSTLKLPIRDKRRLTPYPKTGMRQNLFEQELITNLTDYKRYNGLWANVRTKYLDSEQLQYQFWYQRQVVLGWWDPPAEVKNLGWVWISIWRFIFKPFLKLRYRRIMKKYGWHGRYLKEMERWENMNTFQDLEEY